MSCQHGSALIPTPSPVQSPRGLGTPSEKNHYHKPPQAFVPLYSCFGSSPSHSP